MKTYGKMLKIATIALVAAAGSALAEPVDADEARAAVENWLKSGRAMGCTGMGDVSDVQAYDGREGVGKFYVISLRNGAGEAAGYVVTSADRKLNPVLAYSDDGMFGATDENPLWTMLTIDVSAVTKGLAAEEAAQSSASSGKRLLAAAPTENERKWAELLGGASAGGSGTRLRGSAYQSMSSISDVRVEPLLSTKWDQDYDKHYNDTWNLMTPSNYVCGCVATAAAQIMKYWAWPGASTNITAKTDYTGKVIVGSVTNTWRLSDFTTGANKYRPAFGGTYQWSEMADEYSNSSSEASRLAVAKLVRDLGMSVHMSYKSGASSSMNPIMAVRFTDQFAYANAMCRYPNNENWDAERDNTIRANLDAGLPLGVSVPGHAIIADGYGYESGTLYVHFNMGWGGSKNYWYNPPDLTAAGSRTFGRERAHFRWFWKTPRRRHGGGAEGNDDIRHNDLERQGHLRIPAPEGAIHFPSRDGRSIRDDEHHRQGLYVEQHKGGRDGFLRRRRLDGQHLRCGYCRRHPGCAGRHAGVLAEIWNQVLPGRATRLHHVRHERRGDPLYA